MAAGVPIIFRHFRLQPFFGVPCVLNSVIQTSVPGNELLANEGNLKRPRFGGGGNVFGWERGLHQDIECRGDMRLDIESVTFVVYLRFPSKFVDYFHEHKPPCFLSFQNYSKSLIFPQNWSITLVDNLTFVDNSSITHFSSITFASCQSPSGRESLIARISLFPPPPTFFPRRNKWGVKRRACREVD